jgi:hypothetical protein
METHNDLAKAVASETTPLDPCAQALLTENIEDLQESFALKGLADQPFRNPSCVEAGVFLAA